MIAQGIGRNKTEIASVRSIENLNPEIKNRQRNALLNGFQSQKTSRNVEMPQNVGIMQGSYNKQTSKMSIIIPASVDEESVRIPMQFPLRADLDSVVDANDRPVFTMDDSVAIGESLKFTKLFAKAPDMFMMLGDAYLLLSAVAVNSDSDHGREGENKNGCLLCQMEELLKELQ